MPVLFAERTDFHPFAHVCSTCSDDLFSTFQPAKHADTGATHIAYGNGTLADLGTAGIKLPHLGATIGIDHDCGRWN